MKFVFAEAVIQWIMSFVLLAFLKKRLGIEVFRVGNHIFKQQLFFYFYISFFSCTYFLSGFLQHMGADSTFNFVWLFGNTTNYIPEDAQEGMCQIFNLEPATSDGLDFLNNCLAGQNLSTVCKGLEGIVEYAGMHCVGD